MLLNQAHFKLPIIKYSDCVAQFKSNASPYLIQPLHLIVYASNWQFLFNIQFTGLSQLYNSNIHFSRKIQIRGASRT